MLPPRTLSGLTRKAYFAVFQKYGVTKPRLFGSVARSEADEQSDIDILVSKTASMDYAAIGKFRREVSETLGWPAHVVFESVEARSLGENSVRLETAFLTFGARQPAQRREVHVARAVRDENAQILKYRGAGHKS
jgi:predicted nucleotidyltransferase